MLLGHYGVALALKRAEPRLSLGTLFVAVQLVDILWGVTILLGWERARIAPGWTAANPIQFLSYPITHSLLAGVLWGLAAAALYYSWPTRNTSHHARAAGIVGLAVLSHWLLDFLVHPPDLPIASDGGTKVGLGLWHSVPATIAVELLFLCAGAAVYARYMHGRGRLQPLRLGILVGGLVVIGLANLFAPVPTSMRAVAVGALVLYTLVAVAAVWVDRAPRAAAEHGTRRRGRRKRTA